MDEFATCCDRARVEARRGRFAEAAAAYRAALALEMNDADRAFLERRLAEVTA
jgi:predicted RNA polymerase sigma factor